MELHLEEKEASLLFRVVKNRVTELREEIHHDKNSESQKYLKHKENLLNSILAKFPKVDEKAHMKGFTVPEK
jgi:hypothetical protein